MTNLTFKKIKIYIVMTAAIQLVKIDLQWIKILLSLYPEPGNSSFRKSFLIPI